MQKFKPPTSDLTEAAFTSFVAGVLDGSIVRHLMSEEIPEDNTAPVTIIVGKNFDTYAKDASKAMLVEFYAPWCGHCKQLAPTWDKLGEHFKDDDSVVIAKSDASLIKFVENEGKEVAEEEEEDEEEEDIEEEEEE